MTITLNGVTTVDEEFARINDEGIIAFQLHKGEDTRVTFKDFRFRELNTAAEEEGKSGAPPEGAVVLFDGKDLDGWTHRDGKKAAHWKVLSDGVLQVEKAATS